MKSARLCRRRDRHTDGVRSRLSVPVADWNRGYTLRTKESANEIASREFECYFSRRV